MQKWTLHWNLDQKSQDFWILVIFSPSAQDLQIASFISLRDVNDSASSGILLSWLFLQIPADIPRISDSFSLPNAGLTGFLFSFKRR